MTSTGFIEAYPVIRKIGVPAALLSNCVAELKGLPTAWEQAIPGRLRSQEPLGLAGATRQLILGQLRDSSVLSRISQPSPQW